MDKETRSAIERATQKARKLLEADFGEQLEGTYDVLRSGEVPKGGAHLTERQRRLRGTILDAIEHKRAQGMSKGAGKAKQDDVDPAVVDYLRDAAFTALNRFVALKMLEARELVQESISRGDQSSGYKEYCGLAPGVALLPDGAGYRLYLESIFDELSTEVKVLFDRRDPASVLWPRRQTLTALLDVLSGADLAGVWREDETIGWVYQYFNSKEERAAMRDPKQGGSQAPRNSRELAIRNQFFTPRYVVQFLTDNTLGRIWYQMRQGQTSLSTRCEYMVRYADEVFLGANAGKDDAARAWLEGERGEVPNVEKLAYSVNAYERRGGGGEGANAWVEATLPRVKAETVDGLSTQEILDLLFLFHRKERFCEGTLGALAAEIDLLKECLSRRVERAREQAESAAAQGITCFRHRPPKDPRDLRVLDPACGSGHFLLYAFDLLAIIYEEAWQGCSIDAPVSEVTGKTLRDDYPDLAQLRREVPILILRHNLHGIDIDPRCAQIAALALWMRAQRAFQEAGIGRAERPRVTRTNVVLAEPMPQDEKLIDAFAATLQPPALRPLFKALVEKTKLAGEMGFLLKLEEDLRGLVSEARKQFQQEAQQQRQQGGWLPGFAPVQKQIEIDFSGVTDESFFHDAEGKIRAALVRFGEQAGGGDRMRRRLFAEDAQHGVALLDVLWERQDVVLMNPPFGAGSSFAKKHFESLYPQTKNDIYAAFVERGILLLYHCGTLGAITSRTGFFLTSFQEWRERTILAQSQTIMFADLGFGVLDGAMVETAAYCLERNR